MAASRLDVVAKIFDNLQGNNEATEYLSRLNEAKQKFEAAGYSQDAMAALGHFTTSVQKTIEVAVYAYITCDKVHDRQAGEASIALFEYLLRGLGNCYAMFAKAGVDPKLFMLKDASAHDEQKRMIRDVMAKARACLRRDGHYVLVNADGEKTRLAGATELEAYVDALTKCNVSVQRERN